MSDEKDIKLALNDLLDVALVLTEQINALGVELLAIQAVLEEKLPGFGHELEQAEHAAKMSSTKRDLEGGAIAERAIRRLQERFPR